MIKKLCFLGTLICLVSCSTDDSELKETADKLNGEKTISPPYYSPFEGPITPKSYSFINETDYELEFAAELGVAYYDGTDDNDGVHFGMPMDNMGLLFQGNKEYLNTVTANPILVNPSSSFVIDVGHCAVSVVPLLPKNYFIVPTSSIPNYDGTILYEYGKPYLIDYKIKDAFGNVILQDTIKFRFVDDSYDYTINPQWKDLGVYSKTNEQVVYHEETHEIVIANSVGGTPSIRQFNLDGEEYYITAFTTPTDIQVLFSKVK